MNIIPHKKRAQEKKAKLIKAALKLFDKKGYHYTNAKEIAREAQVATGTFYRYFKDKKAIFLAIQMEMEKGLIRHIKEMGQKLGQDNIDPGLVIETIVKSAMDMHQANKGFHREVLAMEMIDSELKAFSLNRDKRVRENFYNLTKSMSPKLRIQNIDIAIELMYLVIEAVSHKVIIMGSEFERRLVEKETIDLLKRYLLADSNGSI